MVEVSFRGTLVLSLHRQAFLRRYFRDTFQQQHHMGSNFTLQELTVLDAVDQDRVFKYQESIRGAGSSLLAGKYVTIGGRPMDWAMAGLKRTVGLSLFPKDRELFWVRFPASTGALQKLNEMCDGGKLRPVIGAEVLLQDGQVRDAFASLHGRRTVGKLVIKLPQ